VFLENHFNNFPFNATYIIKTLRNNLSEVIDKLIREVILSRIRKTKYYSVMFTNTDISTISQLSLLLTYVFEKKRYEDFVEFIDVHDSIFVYREITQDQK
jgi:hypothetical protein